MGRVISREVIAIDCDVRSCVASFSVTPTDAADNWEAHLFDLEVAVERGWAFILNNKLRAFCPSHAERVWDCSCRRHPERAHLCTSHSQEASAQVWVASIIPDAINQITEAER